MPDVRVVIDQQAIDAYIRDPDLIEALLAAGRGLARAVQAGSARPFGPGAQSIDAVVEGGEIRVSWDFDHDYLRFPEFGTRFQRAQPSLRPALDRYRFL
jgi:HK97 gp10 family phage protein